MVLLHKIYFSPVTNATYTPRMKYNLKLDALRGIAIMLVIVGHWLMLSQTRFSHLGVELFFVLSGFLITTILFQIRSSVESAKSTLGDGLKKFYIRRFIRIFPLYYAVIILCFVFTYPNDTIKEHFVFDLLYLNNIYQWYLNIQPKSFIHLWSLSIEEQFYLIWPFIILMVSSKNLLKTIVVTIAGGIAFRALYFTGAGNVEATYPMGSILLPACIDLFGMGGLLAYGFTYGSLSGKISLSRIGALFGGGIALYAFCLVSNHGYFDKVLFRLASALMSVALITYCYYEKSTVLDFIFTNRLLVHIGKISYGMYLIHLLLPISFIRESYSALLGSDMRFSVELIVRFALLIIVCTLSWYFFEKPVNGLKDKLASYQS